MRTLLFREGGCDATGIENELAANEVASGDQRRRRTYRAEKRSPWVALFERSEQGMREFFREATRGTMRIPRTTAPGTDRTDRCFAALQQPFKAGIAAQNIQRPHLRD